MLGTDSDFRTQAPLTVRISHCISTSVRDSPLVLCPLLLVVRPHPHWPLTRMDRITDKAALDSNQRETTSRCQFEFLREHTKVEHGWVGPQRGLLRLTKLDNTPWTLMTYNSSDAENQFGWAFQNGRGVARSEISFSAVPMSALDLGE